MALSLATSSKPVPWGSDVALMARIRSGKTGSATLITQASVSSIAYVINDLTPTSVQIASGTLTAASVVFDTLQQNDGLWSVDGPSVYGPEVGYGRQTTLGLDGAWGYDFKWQAPGSVWAVAPAVQGDTIEARVTLTMTDGTVMKLVFRFPTI